MTKKWLMLNISASSPLVYFLVGFSSASPLSSPLELLLPSSPVGSMLLRLDVSKVLISTLSCTWYSCWLLFISHTFCPCFHDPTSPESFPMPLSSIPCSPSQCFLLNSTIKCLKISRASSRFSSYSIPFHLWNDMHFHDFTYNLKAVFLELSHCFWFQDSHIQPSVWHLDSSQSSQI